MRRYATLFLCSLLTVVHFSRAAEIVLNETFDSSNLTGWTGVGKLEAAAARGNVLHVTQPPAAKESSAIATISLPVEKLGGAVISFAADVRAQGTSVRPQPWNGVKVMLVVQTPRRTEYPQAELPSDNIAWQRVSGNARIPPDATSVTMVLGLEKVSGDAWFDSVRVVLRRRLSTIPEADPATPVYRGHDLLRLRGAMVPNTLQQADLKTLAGTWNANVIRWQLIQIAAKPTPLAEYDKWLNGQLAYLDQVLTWAEQCRVRVVLDLHSPPGGKPIGAGYLASTGDIFTQPEAQQKFLQTWQRIALRYRGRGIIWGFDLMNEPMDTQVAEGCDDWQDLSLKAARAIHAVDPQRTVIVEPSGWGGPQDFRDFHPLDEPRVVYSFHMYEPTQITHQGILGNAAGYFYPGRVGGKEWNKSALEAAMQPAIDFAHRYRVHMYVGEFSCIRTAPDDSALRYLTDAIDLFEANGFDWSYHAFREWQGWSVEHEGPLASPTLASTSRERLLKFWFAKNVEQP